MKFSNDAMRDTLLFLEENVKYETYKLSERKRKTKFTITMIVESKYFSDLFLKHNYTKDELHYTIEKMIEGNILNTMGSLDSHCEITDISFYGIQLLDSIRPESVWENTKSIAATIGNHSLKFIEDTAQKCAVTATATFVNNLGNSIKTQ